MTCLRQVLTGFGAGRQGVAFHDGDLVGELGQGGGRQHPGQSSADDDGATECRVSVGSVWFAHGWLLSDLAAQRRAAATTGE